MLQVSMYVCVGVLMTFSYILQCCVCIGSPEPMLRSTVLCVCRSSWSNATVVCVCVWVLLTWVLCVGVSSLSNATFYIAVCMDRSSLSKATFYSAVCGLVLLTYFYILQCYMYDWVLLIQCYILLFCICGSSWPFATFYSAMCGPPDRMLNSTMMRVGGGNLLIWC